jgi:hypothetical protein
VVEVVELGGRAGLEVSVQTSHEHRSLTIILPDTVEPCFSVTDNTPECSAPTPSFLPTRRSPRLPLTRTHSLHYLHTPLSPPLTSLLCFLSSVAHSCGGWPSRVSLRPLRRPRTG